MNRSFLRWFYVSVQFIMLAVSIPKVATLFHAYDKESWGRCWQVWTLEVGWWVLPLT